MPAQTWRKRPIEIEAIRWTGDNWPTVHEFVGDADVQQSPRAWGPEGTIEIATLEGVMRAQPGDWIIRGVQGELYPCKPDIFEATYERVNQVAT